MAIRSPLIMLAGQLQNLPPADTIVNPTVTTPSRVFGTVFQPSTTKTTFVSYSVRVTSSLSLLVGAAGRVELLCDATNPPTSVRARVAGGSTGSLTIGLQIQDIAEGPLAMLVPPGWFVLLRTVTEVGSPTYAITAPLEEPF